MIGSGALGCEFLKLYAMLGIGIGEKGEIIIADNKCIKKSDLNKSCLFD